MIQSNIETPHNNTGTSYPALYRNAGDCREMVVLFTGKGRGIVVFDPTGAFGLGHYSEDWVDCECSDEWSPLSSGERVILTQE